MSWLIIKITKLIEAIKKIQATALVALILGAMFFMALASMKNDSLTFDEVAHLPAGYSYLTQKEYRLNPEHPPLIKDIAALPLLFQKINFPSYLKSWQEDANGQWDFGNKFLYHSGNNPDKIIFWARFPMILIMLFLGWFIYKWTKEILGRKTAFLALFLYSFSPTILAHGRFVTFDVAAAAGFFIATYYFIRVLKDASLKNIIIAGLVFGASQLVKFSLFLLVPFFIILTSAWIYPNRKKYKIYLKYLKVLILTLVIGYLLIYPVYLYHVWNYPLEKQTSDIKSISSTFGSKTMVNTIIWMSNKKILKPYTQYSLGLFMTLNRTAGGNNAYFLGQVSSKAWWYYFPIIYFIKEPLALHVLIIIAAFVALKKLRPSLFSHFPVFAMFLFIVIYWLSSVTGNLNIGIRHLLPVFPFTYILVSRQITEWLKIEKESDSPLKLIRSYFKSLGKKFILVILLVWYLVSVVKIFPNFLAYFNEIAGGPDNGYKYVTDSNLDWGQDLKRLAKFVDKNDKIDKIYVDYFGGDEPTRLLGEKYAGQWLNFDSEEKAKGKWLAISLNSLQGGRAKPAKGFNQPTDYYKWLDKYEPIARIGYSIFVYYIP